MRREPAAKAYTALPGWNVFREPSATPLSIRSTIESTNISVWMPRLRWPISAFARAFGTPPMPSWIVAPSGTISAISCPIASSSGRSGMSGSSGSGSSCSTMASSSETWTHELPWTRGMWLLTSAITRSAFSIAALWVSTFVPRLM